jgi:CheY-like chemotaxis protein
LRKRDSAAAIREPQELVLYVEDEEPNYEVAALRLSKGYDLVWARSDREACDLLRKFGDKLSVILMDIQLKGSVLDGMQLAQLIRGTLPAHARPDFAANVPTLKTAIFFVTAYADLYSEEQLFRIGGDRLITKPVDFAALSLALANVHLGRTARRVKPPKP